MLILQADNTLFGKASGSSVVQDCEDYMELLAWLVLTDRSLAGRGPGTVRVLQSTSGCRAAPTNFFGQIFGMM